MRNLVLALLLAQVSPAVRRAQPTDSDPGLVVRMAGDGSPEAQCAHYGKWAGKTCRVVTIFGRRSLGWNSTSVFGDVAQYLDTSQDALNAVSTGTTYFIRSSSANDTAAGTGARTVRIVYLDAAGAQQKVTATLNGTTGVSLGSGFSYFEWAEVATVGTGIVAAGNITISSVVGAPTTAQTVEYIAAGGNRSLSGRYVVPAGYEAHLLDWSLTAQGGGTFDTRLRAPTFADDDTSSGTAPHFKDNAFITSGVGPNDATLHYLKIPAGVEIKVSAIPSAAGAANRLDISFHLILMSL
jgi:hypothetical protein